MSFNTALSGLQAATVDLNVTSNNIANVGTNGFKESRAEFGDLFPVTQSGISNNTVGSGVEVLAVAQQFEQGSMEFTEGLLDMAISGTGFYVLSENLAGTDISYTRAGAYGVDASGYITNSNGQYLQTFPVDALGNVTSTSLNTTIPIQLPAATGAPQASTEVEVGLNLDSTTVGLDPTGFDPTASSSFSHSTSTTAYDSLGTSHIMTYYFIHDVPGSATNAANDPNQWAMFTYLDGVETDITGGTNIAHNNNGIAVPGGQDAAILNFNTDGTFASSTPAPMENTAIALTNGAAPLTLLHDMANNIMTQYAANFAVNTLDPDGFTTGRLTGIDISDEGLISANFSNGVSTPMGQIALAEFPNNQGLKNIGSTQWTETADSGAVIAGIAGSGRFGLIQSGALEASNVDLTSQLVNLITAQRNFQANARSIETHNAITDTVIQIR